MTTKDKEEIIKEINSLLNEYYLFPEVAQKIIQRINENFKKGMYNEVYTPLNFSNVITVDLQSINNDSHLKLKYDPDDTIGRLKPKLEHRIELSRKENFGFEEIKILNGNIGYLKLNRFENPVFAGDTLTAAMNFLCNTDAMILDIMNNPGGNIPMGELMASYFFNDRKHLSSFDFREYDVTHHTYTFPYVYGKQYINKDLYILISANSASAAESFAYDLKHLKRALVIGEQSIGAAHSGSHRSIGDFKLYVPNGRPINPNTKTNWEGVGVTPHIKISKKHTLTAAYLLAIKRLNSNFNNEIYEEVLKSMIIDENVANKVDNWFRKNQI